MRGYRTGIVVLVLILVLALPVFGAGRSEPDRYVLQFNHVLSPADPYHEAFQTWARRVEERTNGGLRIEVHASAALGVEEDILEQIRAGANIGQNTDAARLGQYVPGIAVMNGPYFVDNLDEVQRLRELPTVQGWLAELERTQGFKVLSFMWVQGFRQMIANRPIRTPADLSGLRIRTPPAPIWQESIRAIGATPVALAYGEMYSAMQTRAIDGAELSFTAGYNANFHEVASHFNETNHILLINFQVISSQWFNSLPEEYQRILQEECDRAGLEVSRRYMEELDPASVERLRSAGVQIVRSSEIDMRAFRRAGDAAYQRLNILDVRNQVHRELGK
jgi:TRAP-type transport system periplasmic protein